MTAAAASHLPPKGTDSGELWRKLTALPRPVSDPLDFPEAVNGKPVGQYRLRVLTEGELHYVRREADVAARRMMGQEAPKNGEVSFGYEDIYRNELSVQLVTLACRDVDHPHVLPAFISAKAARERLSTDQFGVLVSSYNHWRRDIGPELSELTKEEMEAWVKILMEGGRRAPLARLTSEALTDLVMHLVAQVSRSAASGSPGSPPADLSPTPTDDPPSPSGWAETPQPAPTT
jgi:hypothetical protein